MPEEDVIDEEREEEQRGSEKKKSGNIFIIIIGIVFVLGAAFFAYSMMNSNGEEEDLSKFEMYEFGEMVVNVPGSNFRLNLIAKVSIKVPNKKTIEEIGKHEDMFVDQLLKILGSKKLEELGPAGQEKLRGDIRNAFNSRPELTEGEVMDVYFTNFNVGH